eukprot:317680-Alexandrium_andersonii.AAC.1
MHLSLPSKCLASHLRPHARAREALNTPPLWRQLPCGGRHPFCDDCLRHFVDGRLAEGDVRGCL